MTGHDSNINVYVGGNYLVREAAAEAEGRIVTLGNFDMDKRDGASPAYRVGVTSGGSDHLAVGANLTVAPGQRLLAEEGTGSGVVRYGGSLDGTVLPATVNSPDAAAPYADLRGDLTDAYRCYAYTGDARRAVTGQALRDGSSTTFEGDGAAPLQIFSVDADLVSGIGGGPTDISFTGIPDGATVLVNVYGDTRTLDSDAVTLPDPDQRRRLLWNFPDATALTLTGAAELEGSVLVGQPYQCHHALPLRGQRPPLHGRFAHPHLGGRVGRAATARVPLRRRAPRLLRLVAPGRRPGCRPTFGSGAAPVPAGHRRPGRRVAARRDRRRPAGRRHHPRGDRPPGTAPVLTRAVLTPRASPAWSAARRPPAPPGPPRPGGAGRG